MPKKNLATFWLGNSQTNNVPASIVSDRNDSRRKDGAVDVVAALKAVMLLAEAKECVDRVSVSETGRFGMATVKSQQKIAIIIGQDSGKAHLKVHHILLGCLAMIIKR